MASGRPSTGARVDAHPHLTQRELRVSLRKTPRKASFAGFKKENKSTFSTLARSSVLVPGRPPPRLLTCAPRTRSSAPASPAALAPQCPSRSSSPPHPARAVPRPEDTRRARRPPGSSASPQAAGPREPAALAIVGPRAREASVGLQAPVTHAAPVTQTAPPELRPLRSSAHLAARPEVSPAGRSGGRPCATPSERVTSGCGSKWEAGAGPPLAP